MLTECGTEAEVPALAKFLTNDELSSLVRLPLERIPGAQANQALVKALDKTKACAKVGIVSSLGARKDKANLPVLAGLLRDRDEAVAQAAAAGIGVTGGAEAAQAIASALPAATPKVRAALVDAWLKCADQFLAEKKTADALAIYESLMKEQEASFVQLAAYRGILAAKGGDAATMIIAGLKSENLGRRQVALGAITALPGNAIGTLLGAMPALDPDTQAGVILAMAARKEKAALPIVTESVASANGNVRAAAISALGVLATRTPPWFWPGTRPRTRVTRAAIRGIVCPFSPRKARMRCSART